MTMKTGTGSRMSQVAPDGNDLDRFDLRDKPRGSIKAQLCVLFFAIVAACCMAAVAVGRNGSVGKFLRSSRPRDDDDEGMAPDLESRDLFAAAPPPTPDYFFIHVPPNRDAAGNIVRPWTEVRDGLNDIKVELVKEWQAEHGAAKTPKICWVGFAGRWFHKSKPKPNNAGICAKKLGGDTMAISFCAVHKKLSELWDRGDCDIIVAMGEGSNQFTLERQGDEDTKAWDVKNCHADLPSDAFPGAYTCPSGHLPLCDQYVVPPICQQTGQCRGTHFNDKSARDGSKDKATKIREELGGKAGNNIPVVVGDSKDGAGTFCCGFAACWLDW